MIQLILITIIILAICFVGIAVKIWAKKGGRFSGTCSSQNLNDGESCNFCGKSSNESKKCNKN